MTIRQHTRVFPAIALLFFSCLTLCPGIARTSEDPLPRPPELARDVAFWIRVYSEITTNQGFLHDQNDLGIVYRTIKFRPSVTPKERRESVDAEREKLEGMLRRLAAGAVRPDRGRAAN